MEARLADARAEAANAAGGSDRPEALIAHLKLQIEKLRRELYGSRSERKARLLDQMELELEELEAAATEDELAAEQARGATRRRSAVRAPAAVAQAVSRAPAARAGRHRRARRAAPAADRPKLSKLGEDVTETLEVIPRRWKVIQTVREKFTLPRLRDDHAAAGAVPRDAARLCRAEPAGHDPVREVRAASAA